MEEQLIPIGFFVILVGIVIIIIGTFLAVLKSKQTKVEWGFGGILWFIPFGYWSSKRMMYFVIVSLVILSILFFVLTKKLI
ncbi:MAG: hypothetical protein QMD36_01585 [Candidatus Aenigmarchaeota archaeon]|nr:hypothetical protein [Candidatus Aenigmarchaeota archaeon]